MSLHEADNLLPVQVNGLHTNHMHSKDFSMERFISNYNILMTFIEILVCF